MHDFEANWGLTETAPRKEGAVVIGYSPDHGFVICFRNDGGGWNILFGADGYHDDIHLTHWMPLPDPPDDGYAKPPEK